MGSFFDAHINLSDSDFSNYLAQNIHSGDICEGMIDNIDIFRLSSLLRELIGEGSHRQLVTTMVFCHNPKFTHFFEDHFCEAILVEYFPPGVFSDLFELQHLVLREVFLSVFVFGDKNLELPSALSNRSVVEIHIDVKSDAHKVVVQLPLHSRYPPLDSSGYSNITIGKPDLFMRCRPKDSQIEPCSWTLIDLGVLSTSNVTWRIPCGNEVHTRPVTIITFLSALICSLLIVLSTICQSKNRSKLE
ncbi:uncharacterized protein LOC110022753 isoform X2 [Phalaenopsis equestris]|nr:uncharacterized protein LOC110022753 isoform X2 [Phalaenopsis equestris]